MKQSNNKEQLHDNRDATSRSSIYYIDANKSRLRILRPKTNRVVPKLVEKSSQMRLFRNKLSEVGCVLFEVQRVNVTLSLWLENAILHSQGGSSLTMDQVSQEYLATPLKDQVSQDILVTQLNAVFSEFEKQVRQLQMISAIVREQIEREVYDETCLDILSRSLETLKNNIKDFWKEALHAKEKTND